LQNGELLAAADAAGFEAFVTSDKTSSTSGICALGASASLSCSPQAGRESSARCRRFGLRWMVWRWRDMWRSVSG